MRARLYTPGFIGLLVIALAGFAQNFLLQPLLPLLVLDLGGDAVAIGLIFAVFSVPSVLLRPWIGRLADRFGFAWALLAGSLGLAVLMPLYVLPSLLLLVPIRVLHGLAWAAFNTGATAELAQLAPRERRVEASGVYDLMPAIASLAMPALGLVVLAAAGFGVAFAVATALGVVATGVALVAFRPRRPTPAARTGATTPRRYLEPSAILPMLVVLLYTSATSLLLVFPPLFAQERGIALLDVAIYYVVFGVTLVTVRLLGSRFVESLPRWTVLVGGGVLALASMLIGAVAGSMPVLAAAGITFAVGYGLTTPTAQAVVMDLAPRERLGAAMATYTIGFQVGSGLGAALWGAVIGPFGFAVAFLAAAAIQAVLVVLVLVRRTALTGGPEGPGGSLRREPAAS